MSRSPKSRSRPAGRPKVSKQPNIVSLLEVAFRSGLNVSQACLHAGISRDAFYNNLRINDEFADKMSLAQQHTSMRAKQVISAAIDGGNIKLSMWWLENYQAEEFRRGKLDPIQQIKADVEAEYEAYDGSTETLLELTNKEIIRLQELAASLDEVNQQYAAVIGTKSKVSDYDKRFFRNSSTPS